MDQRAGIEKTEGPSKGRRASTAFCNDHVIFPI